MFRIYLPPNRSMYSKRFNRSRLKDGLYAKRRFDLTENFKIIYSVWFFVFLIFACRIPLVSLLLLFDLKNYNIYINSISMELPNADNACNISHSGRMILIISLYENKKLVVDRQEMDLEEFEPDSINFIDGYYNRIVLLKIEKNVKMKYVNKVQSVLRKAGLRKVYYLTYDT